MGSSVVLQYTPAPGYTFHQGQTATGDVISSFPNLTVPELAALCSRLVACDGFTSKGELLRNGTAIKPADTTAALPCSGTYARNKLIGKISLQYKQ